MKVQQQGFGATKSEIAKEVRMEPELSRLTGLNYRYGCEISYRMKTTYISQLSMQCAICGIFDENLLCCQCNHCIYTKLALFQNKRDKGYILFKGCEPDSNIETRGRILFDHRKCFAIGDMGPLCIVF